MVTVKDMSSGHYVSTTCNKFYFDLSTHYESVRLFEKRLKTVTNLYYFVCYDFMFKFVY